MKNLVDAAWVKEHIEEIRVVDCRFNLANRAEGQEKYRQDHIPGAVYFHLEEDLSGTVSIHGGRHPLPSVEQLTASLQKAGISNGTTIVAYDGGEASFASRFWWLLKYVGHERVYVLDGGYKEWLKHGYPVNDIIPAYDESNYQVQVVNDICASYEEVKEVSSNETAEAILIDSREEQRYKGINEPIDKKAGHIPGAVNKVWTDALSEGRFKSGEEQSNRFSEYDKNTPLIVYCGSGVTASPNFLALKEAGFKNVKLYPGSFSDWISYDDNPVGTKK
ncbi:sulfurtransferase [Bacillus sp. CRN 9]|nr:sulfurtransferase [Bacillus sp. CRN 9]